MPNVFILNPAFLALLGVFLALPLLYLIFHTTSRPRAAPLRFKSSTPRSAVLLYRNGFLADANPAGLALIDGDDSDPELWTTLVQQVAPRFPNFPKTQGCRKTREIRAFSSADPTSPALLTLEQWDDFARVRLSDTEPAYAAKEAASCDITAQHAPCPIWITEPSGKIIWVNEAYQALAHQCGKDSSSMPRLFPKKFQPGEMQRTELKIHNREEPLWFDISTRQTDTALAHYAISADAIVRAENAQRNFVQTLTKTFAQLSIGLAIFDRNRQLTLFNPALIDLTNLPADFLSSRPSLFTFFDRLRETRMIPEPKNYSSWRQQIAELVIAATDDRYCETWSLPSGVTYKINGRPHPDGAIALLFEDISAEVSLTRRFRSQLDLVQAVLDSLDEAVIVFSPVGTATFSNGAYRRFWQAQPESELSDYSIHDALHDWKTHFQPSDIWSPLEDYLTDINPRPDLYRTIKTNNNKAISVRVVYLHGGNKAVVFSQLTTSILHQPDTETSSNITYPACGGETAV